MRALFISCLLLTASPLSAQTPDAPAPAARISYGAAPSQGGELYLPAGAGPHPVVVLIHGGCYQTKFGGRDTLIPLAAELAASGVAVWNIGYRRLEGEEGAYPNMFADVGMATDRLAELAAANSLDLDRVITVGHSAGGHLALWVASRGQIPAVSPLHVDKPLPIRAAISIAGAGDIKTMAPHSEGFCFPGLIDRMAGTEPGGRTDRFVDISPGEMVPADVPTLLVHGALDQMLPPPVGALYVAKATAAGGTSELLSLPTGDHFNVVTPGTPEWAAVKARILAAVDATR